MLLLASLQLAIVLSQCSEPAVNGGPGTKEDEEVHRLTLMPSNLDRALKGLRARSVLRDLMAPISANPTALATILTTETWNTNKQLFTHKQKRTH